MAAAVLGPAPRCPTSSRSPRCPSPSPALDEAVRAGLLGEVLTGTAHHVVFPHELVRAAVYADLSPARRHALHRAAAALLGGPAGVDHRIAAAVGPDPDLAAELTALGRDEVGARRWTQAADRLMAAADLSGTTRRTGPPASSSPSARCSPVASSPARCAPNPTCAPARPHPGSTTSSAGSRR